VAEAEAMSAGGGAEEKFLPQSTQRAQRNFILKVKGIIIKIQEKDFALWFLCLYYQRSGSLNFVKTFCKL
jgi:hypothetical protein